MTGRESYTSVASRKKKQSTSISSGKSRLSGSYRSPSYSIRYEEEDEESPRRRWNENKEESSKFRQNDKAKDTMIRSGRKFCWGFVTKDVAEYSSVRNHYMRIYVRDAIIYFVFMSVILLRSYSFKRPEHHLLHENFRQKFILQQFLVANKTKQISFVGIRTVKDLWEYLDTVVVRRLYDGDYYDSAENQIRIPLPKEKMIMYHNRLIGVPRIRQQRAHNQSCRVHHKLQSTFQNCYFDITEDKMIDKSNFSKLSYEYHNSTGSPPYKGIAATYEDGGYIDYFAPIKTMTRSKLKLLRKNSFITMSTRFIILNFSYYNANFDCISVCGLIFELPRIGGVWTRFFHVPLYLHLNATSMVYLEHALKAINLLFVLFYIFQTFTDIWFFKSKSFSRFTIYLDVAHVIAGLLCVVYRTMLVLESVRLMKRESLALNSREYVNLEWVKYFHECFKKSLGIYTFLSYLKVFKFLGVNKTMIRLKNTLSRSTSDILNFSVMFSVILVGFGEMFYLLFGNEVFEFRKFTRAIFSLIRTIFGDFNYEPLSYNKVYLAPIISVFYVFFIFFVLVNMFMAIITESFMDVKTDMAIAPDEYELSDYLRKKFKDLLVCLRLSTGKRAGGGYEFKGKPVRELLINLDFPSDRIEKFMKKYQSVSNPAFFDLHRMQADVKEHNVVYGNRETGTNKVYARDYMEFQEKLEAAETSVNGVAEQIALLVRRLDILRNVRKRPRLVL